MTTYLEESGHVFIQHLPTIYFFVLHVCF